MKGTVPKSHAISISLFSYLQADDRVKHSIDATSGMRDTTNRTKSSSYGATGTMDEMRFISYCSRSDYCPAMKCPLDPCIDERMEYDEDLDGEFKDSRCTMAKATRHRYWESMPEDLWKALPFQGYFRSEYNRMEAARKRWESMSENERDRIREIGRARLMGSRRSKP